MSMFDCSEFDNHEVVKFVRDPQSGLRAIIAIHNTKLGPAAGGIRMYSYANSGEALSDVLKLSRGMSYKSALAGLPLGGGKTVVIGDPGVDKTEAMLKALGGAIDQFSGAYTAGEDVGILDADMEIIASVTPHAVQGDAAATAPATAVGIFYAMKTAVEHKLGKSTLDGVRVAIQGMGKVATHLAGLLAEEGAEVFGADLNKEALESAVKLYGVKPVEPEDIIYQDVDVYAPCALGGTVNANTIPHIKASVICGAANNQLGSPSDDHLLLQRDILFLPDYAVNAGGVIHGVSKVMGASDVEIFARLLAISTTCKKIIELSEDKKLGTQEAADCLAKDIISKAQTGAE